ncbi:hypothetical protein LSTR_LSTR011246 [Laodelphax striatellus]|uniref:protein-tyrosine-phosphatase n=1 Tax=Laodelphax striatellus TaxID=195883 RepID=A0A482X3L1_LAOST|nr:hypothetical protein LSTR_LSTR011246 [Laodelphax striatellus]WJZ52881.1 tyrosine-protein phosphatase non-receptor type 2-like protein [Laodelphax striatellus]
MDSESKIKNQFDNIDASNAWPLLIQEIKKDCSKYDYTVSEAKKMANKFLNRYRDVIPYDHTRIVLSKGDCDYINANLVKVEKAERHYILTQGPLPFTTSHFWLMVWEQKCKAVIMLNKVIEKNMIKCHQYWPVGSKNGGEDDMMLTDVGLKVELMSETDCSYYITRKLRLTDVESRESREILHFQYTTWPDYGIPQSPTAFLHFLGDIRKCGALSSSVGPAVVHCSAGIGRSGSFCLVDSCLVIIKEKQLDDLTIRDILMEMRKYRMGLVQTAEQLRFCYLAIMEGLKDNFEDSEMPINDSEINNHEDEPPPLPPPRSESLPPLPPLPQPPPDDDDDDEDDDDDDIDESPSESSSSSESSRAAVTQPENGPKSPTSEGLRQRKEKLEMTAKKVEEMKRKQKEAEDWAQLKRRRKDNGDSEAAEKTITKLDSCKDKDAISQE